MEIKIGSIIKIICANNLIEGGTLLEYNKNQLVLKLIDNSIFIVKNPDVNVIAIKYQPIEEEKDKKQTVLVDEEIQPTQYYDKEDLRLKNLAELHKLKAEEERKRALELLRTQKITGVAEVSFGYPNFTKSLPKYPAKKTR